MKAFWTVAATTGDGTPGNPRRPLLDFGGEPHTVLTVGDLVVARPTAGAGNHRHLLSGTLTVPHPVDGHWHRVVQRKDGTVYQEMVDATGTVANHNHAGDLWPDYYLVFVRTTDTGAANLLANNGVREIAPATIDPDGRVGDVLNTLYTTTERNWLVARMTEWLGLGMPAVVDRPSRWVEWLLPLSLTRVVRDERSYRFV